MAESRAARADRWTDPDLAAAAEALRATYGLEFGPTRIASAEDAMRRVMRTLHIADARALRDLATRSAEVQEALVGELTIGETYFFREAGHLDFVRRALLPAFARDAGAGALRVWSAGCSTGEEPYSLAMLLVEAGWTLGATLLATDLVPGRLAHARRGRYGQWSMRGVPEETIARWFSRQGRAYVLDESIRASVDFRVLDLACDDYAKVAGATGMDVVFCRNVLIYFDPPTVRHVAARLLESLSPRGWLFLSATDPVLSDFMPCEAIPTGAGYAYRRADHGWPTSLGARPRGATPASGMAVVELAPAPAPEVRSKPIAIPPASRNAAVPARPAARPVSPTAAQTGRATGVAHPTAPAAPSPTPSDEDGAVAAVRVLANRGALDEAGQACAAALDRHPLSARLSTLHATLLLSGGRPAEAAAAARRSLYLDRRAPVAHLILGDALARMGDASGAAHAFGIAAELLALLPADAPVADADGEPAGRLAEMARYRAAGPR